MRVFGNIMNRVMENTTMPVPEVGMGCTILSYSDRTAATIVEIKSTIKSGERVGMPSVIAVKEDNAIRTDKNGMSESQEYVYEPNPEGVVKYFKLAKDGSYCECGQDGHLGSARGRTHLLIGIRRHYHDYSF